VSFLIFSLSFFAFRYSVCFVDRLGSAPALQNLSRQGDLMAKTKKQSVGTDGGGEGGTSGNWGGGATAGTDERGSRAKPSRAKRGGGGRRTQK
jgi:hypothetical protein